MKKLLLCLCLALFAGVMVFPSASLPYVAPNADGVRVGQGIPFPLIPEALKPCVRELLGPNILLNFFNDFYNAGEGYTPCQSAHCWTGWWPSTLVYFVPTCYCNGVPTDPCCNGAPTPHCVYHEYEFANGGSYNPDTYDFDGDGIPDAVDANPDTPPSQLAKGCMGDNNNTAYDDQQAATQGASAPGG